MESYVMRTQKNALRPSHHRQRGAVLAVSLLILLVLTVLGISSLDGSIMEEKMAANAQISTTTFQEADSAVRQAYYQEKLFDPEYRALAVDKARNNTFAGLSATQNANTSSTHSIHGMTKSAALVYPTTPTPLYNSSAGTFVAHGIEIVGTASVDNISSTSRQGYSIYPMRP